MLNWLRRTTASTSRQVSDYSAITTLAKAEALLHAGELHRLFLRPLEFGGMDVPMNIVYVPAFVVEAKRNVDFNIVRPMIETKQARQYIAEPQYDGDSFVPCAIRIAATNPGNFSTLIEIWGKALVARD